MRRMEVPLRCWRRRRSSRIAACTVTSRAEVGSSAIRTLGFRAVAMAIMTLCAIPPDRWKGYRPTTSSGSGSPICARMSRLRLRASCLDTGRWAVMISSTCSPTESTGFRPVAGSWNTMAISLPRIRRSSSADRPRTSLPSNRMWPAVIRPGCGRRLSTASPTLVLPAPLSPVIASVLPRLRDRETSLAAFTAPSAVSNWAHSPSMRRIGSSSEAPPFPNVLPADAEPACHVATGRLYPGGAAVQG